jgi:NAD(P)-dependent dehydrogenase (short-subunit alcohol dehydrogenase family)
MERILVTGASRGIGRAIAVRLAAPTRELLLHGRDGAALAETARLVAARGAASRLVTGDLARADDVEALAAAVDGALHVLVNNAGEAIVKPVEAIALEEWQRSLAVGVTAPFLLIQRLLSQMPDGASIVNVLSIAARRGFGGWSAYCAAKFALEGLSQCVREEARDRGVRIVNVYPAATDTALWNTVSGRWPRERMIAPDEVAEAVAYALARPRGTVVERLEIGEIRGAI